MCEDDCDGSASEFNEASVVCHPLWSVENVNEGNMEALHICSEVAGSVA